MLRLPENQVDVLEWLDRWCLDAVRFSSGSLNALIGRHLPVYPLRLISSLFLTRMRLPKSDQFVYTIVIRADRTLQTMQFKNETPVEVLRQAFQACESCALQCLDLNLLRLTTEVMDVFAEHLPSIPLGFVRLFEVWNGDGGTMDSLLKLIRGLSEVDLRPDPAEQATDATLGICREIGVRKADIFAADWRSDAVGISEEGIFDFCFGAVADTSSDSVRKLEVSRPHLTPQFLGRLISMNLKSSSKIPQILKINTNVVFETTAFLPVPRDRHPGLCYRFECDTPFQLYWHTEDGILELRRDAGVDAHAAQPKEDESKDCYTRCFATQGYGQA